MMFSSRISACSISAAFAVALMLSPDALMLLGNSAGYAGKWILWITTCVFIVHLCNGFGYARLFDMYEGPQAELALIKKVWGALPALMIAFASRFVLFACLTTGLLVTSGFVFNEVFLYWFPNFSFAALLLAVIFIINLLGKRVVFVSQVAFAAAALLCLIVLCFAGSAAGNPEAIQLAAETRPGRVSISIFLMLLVFIGYDLAGFARSEHEHGPESTRFGMLVGLSFVFILFLVWNRLSITHVSPERLSDTTIPHILVAKALFGQTGRVLIGLAAIFGACAAVNALLFCTHQMVSSMVRLELIPKQAAIRFARVPLALVLLAVCPAVMMTLGLAGTPELDIFVRAGLWFWLLGYAVVHLSFLVLQKHAKQSYHAVTGVPYWFLSAMLVFVIAAALCGLLVYYEAPLQLFKYLVWIAIGTYIFSLACVGLRKAIG